MTIFRSSSPQRMHVVDEQQERGKFLPLRGDAEFGHLLAAGIAEPLPGPDRQAILLWRRVLGNASL